MAFPVRLLVEAEAGCCCGRGTLHGRVFRWVNPCPSVAHSPPLVIPTGAKRSGGMIKGRGVAFSLRWLVEAKVGFSCGWGTLHGRVFLARVNPCPSVATPPLNLSSRPERSVVEEGPAVRLSLERIPSFIRDVGVSGWLPSAVATAGLVSRVGAHCRSLRCASLRSG